MTTRRPEKGDVLTRGVLFRLVSNAAVKWENGVATERAFDPQPGDKGISFFLQSLLNDDHGTAANMVMAGHEQYGLVEVDVERFYLAREEWRKDVPEIQEVVISYDPNDLHCGAAHYYLVEATETQKLNRYIKEVLVEVASTVQTPPFLRGGTRPL